MQFFAADITDIGPVPRLSCTFGANHFVTSDARGCFIHHAFETVCPASGAFYIAFVFLHNTLLFFFLSLNLFYAIDKTRHMAEKSF